MTSNLYRKTGGALLALLLIVIGLSAAKYSALKYKNKEMNYLNSDATWHTLLTITAYNKTPISIHKFLPIVSLGNQDDKNIPWGATIPDKNGNYYYTSFTAPMYFLPYLFFKIFHLKANERDLYLFNSLLLLISVSLWFTLLLKVFAKNKNAIFISFLGTLIYIFSPEIFHGMGIVYWAQSVFQVSFLIQLLAFYSYKYENSNFAKKIFYVFCFLNPYIEWTGYVANVGFAFAELIFVVKSEQRKNAIISVLIIASLTCLSFAFYCLHYLLNVDAKLFFETVKQRFLARNISTSVPISSLLTGYFTSFKYLWIILFGFVCVILAKTEKIYINHRILIFVIAFPLLENILMKEHSISYTYDRMKLAFLISFLSCVLLENIFSQKLIPLKKSLLEKSCVFVFASFFCLMNLKSYLRNQNYNWQASYRTQNKEFASYINSFYPDSILCIPNCAVRGYMNMLFGRGIYEWRNLESLEENAKQNDKTYVIQLEAEGEPWNMLKFTGAKIKNIKTQEII